MNRGFPALCALALGVGVGLAAPKAFASSEDAESAGRTLRTSVDGVLAVLRDKEMPGDRKRRKVMALVEPLFDLPLMAKLALGREHWPKLDPGQRKEFTDLFIEQLQASYYDKVDLVTNETVEYGKPSEEKGKYQVATHVVSKDKRIKVVYKLYKAGRPQPSWRVYDVEIEGVSIVKSYGSQYGEVLRNGTVGDLLAKMREKVRKQDAP